MYTTYKYSFLQQKKLFIWNMHYQYKLGDCEIYTVLVSSENTKPQWESKGMSRCSHRSGKAEPSEPKQGRARRVTLRIMRTGRAPGRKPTTGGKHFKITGDAQGKERRNKREEGRNSEGFI